MTKVHDQKFWDNFDHRMYNFYKTLRKADRVVRTVAEVKAATEEEFGENADWCEDQYQDDLRREGI